MFFMVNVVVVFMMEEVEVCVLFQLRMMVCLCLNQFFCVLEIVEQVVVVVVDFVIDQVVQDVWLCWFVGIGEVVVVEVCFFVECYGVDEVMLFLVVGVFDVELKDFVMGCVQMLEFIVVVF